MYSLEESFDYKFFNEGSEGLKVALVHHLDMPIVRQVGFHISPGTENQIAVTPTLISTSRDAMLRFSPDRRDCYSEGEIRETNDGSMMFYYRVKKWSSGSVNFVPAVANLPKKF